MDDALTCSEFRAALTGVLWSPADLRLLVRHALGCYGCRAWVRGDCHTSAPTAEQVEVADAIFIHIGETSRLERS